MQQLLNQIESTVAIGEIAHHEFQHFNQNVFRFRLLVCGKKMNESIINEKSFSH